MKKVIAILMVLMGIYCAEAGGNPAVKLIKRLAKIEKQRQFAFGHHDDTAYGHTWNGEPNRSDVKDVCGDYPGIMNWDLGLIEYNEPKELDGVPFDFIRDEVAKQDKRGAMSSFSWHPRNPVTGGDSWNTEGGNVVHECVTEGTALNDTIKLWIARAADFIGSLRDSKGRRIGVIFRPWHEHTGSWFWWGHDHCSIDDYKALWKLTRQVFDEKGIDNVVWAYSPDKDNVTDEASYLERYPGDEYVDIMGGDVYHFDGEKGVTTYLTRMHNVLGAASKAALNHGKLMAFTETGSEGIPMDDWWMEVLYNNIMRYPICYVSVWRNSSENPKHFYAPWKGQGSEKSFVEFYNMPKTLFAKDLKKIK